MGNKNLFEHTRDLAGEELTYEDKLKNLDALMNDSDDEDTTAYEVEQEEKMLGGKTEGEKFSATFAEKQAELEKMLEGVPDKKSTLVPFTAEDQIEGAKAASLAAVKGVGKSVEDLANGVYALSNFAEDFFAERGLGDGKWLQDGQRFNLIDAPKNPADNLVFMASRYLLPFAAVSRLISTGAKALGWGAKAAMTADVVGTAAYTGLTADPEEKRLADLAESSPVWGALFPDALSSKEGDTNLDSRLKNFGEALLIGGYGAGITKLVTGISKTVKSNRAVNKANQVLDASLSETEVMSKKLDELSVETGLNKSDDAATKMLGELSDAPTGTSTGAVAGTADTAATKIQELTPDQATAVAQAEEIFKNSEPKNINYDKVAATESPHEMIEALGLMDDPVFQKLHGDFKGGVISIDDAMITARKMLKDPKEVKRVLNRDPRAPIVGEEFLMLHLMAVEKGNTLTKLAETMTDAATLAEKNAFDFALSDFRQLVANMKGGSSEAMRVGRYSQEVLKFSGDALEKVKYLQESAKLGDKNRGDIARYLAAGKKVGVNIPELISVVSKGERNRLADVLYSSFINGALYNVSSFLYNTAGHVGTAGFHLGETTLGAVIPGSGISFREIPAIPQAWAASLVDSITAAGKVFVTGKVPAGFSSKFDLRPSAFNEFDGMFGVFMKGLGFATEVPTRGLMAADVASNIMQSRARLQQLAVRNAVSSGATGEQAKRMIKNYMANPPAHMELAAERFAKTQTFTDRDYKNMLLGGVGDLVAQAARYVPGGRVFIPFTQTATNIASYTAMRTPLQFFSTTVRKAWAAGGAARGEQMAKLGMGLGIGAIGAYMATNGTIRVKSNDYMGERAMGTPNDYSAMKIGGEWIPIEKLGPPAQLLFMGAEIANLHRYFSDKQDSKIGELALNYSAILATNVLPKYITESMADYLEGISSFIEGDSKGGKLVTGAANILETSIPMRWMYKNVGDSTDPVRRDTKAEPDMDKILALWTETKNKFMESAGIADKLPMQKNIWGVPLNLPIGVAYETVSPFAGKADEDMNFYDKELRRLALDEPIYPFLSETDMALRITMPDRVVSAGDAFGRQVTYELNSDQYSDFIDFMNEPHKGKTMRGEVEKILDSDLEDRDKKFRIKEEIETWKGIAKYKMLKDEMDINEKYERVLKDTSARLKGIE